MDGGICLTTMPRTTDPLTRVQLLDGVRMTMTTTNGTTAVGLSGAGRSSSSSTAVHHTSGRCSTARAAGRPLAARDEIRSLQFYRALIAECLATFLYVFLVCGAHLAWLHPASKISGVSSSAGTATMSIVGGGGRTRSMILDSAAAAATQHEHHHQQSQQQYGWWSVQAALTSGFAMSTAVLCFGRISGGHINPAVTISLLVTRRVTPLRAFLYVTAQCGGSIAGAALLQGMSVTGHQAGVGSVRIHDLLTPWQGFGIETILAFAIVFASYASMDFTGCNVNGLYRTSSTSSASVSPLIGVAYLVCTLTGLPSTGAALNPARALGPAFVMNRWANHWVYWLGPVSGGLLAGLIYEYVFDPGRTDGGEEADPVSDGGGRQLRMDDINRANSSAHSQDDDYDDPTDVALTSLPCHQHQAYNGHVIMATAATPPPPPPPLPNVSVYRHVPHRMVQQHYDTYRPPSSSHYGVLPRRGEPTYGTLACNLQKTGASSTASSSVNYGHGGPADCGLYGTAASHRPSSTASGTYATIHGNRTGGLSGGMSRMGVPSQSLHRLEYDAGGPDSTKF